MNREEREKLRALYAEARREDATGKVIDAMNHASVYALPALLDALDEAEARAEKAEAELRRTSSRLLGSVEEEREKLHSAQSAMADAVRRAEKAEARAKTAEGELLHAIRDICSARDAERAAVVAYLLDEVSDAIERGEHVKGAP